MEKVWGPVNGLYIAAYAAPTGEGNRYCSYAKVCTAPPGSYWDTRECIFKVFGGESHRSAEVALLAAQLQARSAIGAMPPSAITLMGLGLRCASRHVLQALGAAARHRMA